MQGYSVKLPLVYDKTEDGPYALNKTMLDTIRQNFKMILLTNPGEKVMNSDFGVGLRRLIFEPDTQDLRNIIKSRIDSQIQKYLNFIQIEEINLSEPNDNDENTLFINIRYSVPILSANDELNIEI